MSIAYPIPRSLRRTDYTATAGQTLFGPVGFKAYDSLDVAVYVRPAGGASFERQAASSYVISFAEPLPGAFYVNLTVGRVAGEVVRIQGERLHERQLDVTRAGALISASLESELDKQTVILQELRRDNTDTQQIAHDALAAVDTIDDDITALEAGKVNKSGDAMTGPLLLPAPDPIAPTQATHKAYVDQRIATHTHPAAQITDFPEAVDDRVATLLVAGNNVTLNYNDAANSLTIAAEGDLSGILLPSVSPTVDGQLVIEATNNMWLTFKYRGHDGVTRIFEMPLVEATATPTGPGMDFSKRTNTMLLAALWEI